MVAGIAQIIMLAVHAKQQKKFAKTSNATKEKGQKT